MNSSNFSDVYYCDDFAQLKEVTMTRGMLAFIAAVLMPGNIIILLVSLKSAYSPNRIYVAALATVDFAVCLQYVIVTLASALLETHPSVSGPQQVILSIGVDFSNNVTLTLLVVIAFDRYLAVCQPGRPQLTKTRVTQILLAAILCGLLSSFLCEVLIFTGQWNLAGMFICLEWASATCFMIVCYQRLSCALYKRLQMKKKLGVAVTVVSVKLKTTPGTTSSSQAGQSKTTISMPSESGNVRSADRGSAKVGDSTSTAHVGTIHQEDKQTSVHKLAETEQNIANSVKGTSRNAHLIRTSTMFFVSWSPFMLLINGVDIPCDLGFCFVLNSVVNPLVFIGLSKQYRADAVKVLTCQQLC